MNKRTNEPNSLHRGAAAESTRKFSWDEGKREGRSVGRSLAGAVDAMISKLH